MSSSSTYEDAIARYNAGDVDGFANAHAENAVLVTPTGSFAGRAAIREYWSNQRTAFPDLLLIVHALVAEGELLAAEWTWVGTNTGPLVLRGGARPAPTGRRVELKGMELVLIHDEKISEYHLYWDGAASTTPPGSRLRAFREPQAQSKRVFERAACRLARRGAHFDTSPGQIGELAARVSGDCRAVRAPSASRVSELIAPRARSR